MDIPAPLITKQPRASKPKTRTGCKTCKIRHVKCDETKPSCHRCQFAGRECGYAALAPLVLHPSRRRSFVPIQSCERPKQQDWAGKDLISIYHRSLLCPLISPSVSIPGNENERRYFQLFHEQIALDLCGYFLTPFFTRLVLQECHREPAIRHEIFALSALCKASTSQTDQKDSHRQFALIQQSKALRSLRSGLSKGSVRLALIASLIFSSFESLHGNVETAARQISCGVRLLRSWHDEEARLDHKNTRKATSKSTQTPATIDPEIYGALGRLELQLMTFVTMNPWSDDTFEGAEGVTEIGNIPIPHRLLSLEGGLPSAIQICMLTLDHMRKCVFYKTSAPPIAFPDSIIHNQSILINAISHWRTAFAPLFQDIGVNVSSPAHFGALQFDICVRVFLTIVATSLSSKETVYDEYNERFQYVVNSSRDLLQKDHKLRCAVSRPNVIIVGGADAREDGDVIVPRLQFDMGLIFPLFYTATRCREPFVRRQAIALLRKWKGRNGIWDGLQAACIAEWIVSIEEDSMIGEKRGRVSEDSCDGGPKGFVMEEWRVRMHTLKWHVDAEGDGINVECLQGAGLGESNVHKTKLPCR